MTKDLIEFQRQRKQQFESNLRDLIVKFNKDTGLHIESIEVFNITKLTANGEKETSLANLDVKVCL